jgi:putative FmdB family regulatory protein
MPIYEYRRPDGSTFEIVQSFSDDSLTHDPDTGVPVERVLHAPAVHFKGKGFYNTDYGKRKRGRSSSDGDSADSGGEGSSSSSSPSDAASKDGKTSKDTKTSSKDAKGGSSSGKDQKTVAAGSSGS